MPLQAETGLPLSSDKSSRKLSGVFPAFFSLLHTGFVPLSEAPAPEPVGGFQARALELMKERNLDEKALCRRANMSRRHYVALKNRAEEPTRREALALCVGLGLTLEEARALLTRTGHILSGRDRGDVIAAWCVARGWDIYRLNAALYAMGEEPLCFM